MAAPTSRLRLSHLNQFCLVLTILRQCFNNFEYVCMCLHCFALMGCPVCKKWVKHPYFIWRDAFEVFLLSWNWLEPGFREASCSCKSLQITCSEVYADIYKAINEGFRPDEEQQKCLRELVFVPGGCLVENLGYVGMSYAAGNISWWLLSCHESLLLGRCCMESVHMFVYYIGVRRKWARMSTHGACW